MIPRPSRRCSRRRWRILLVTAVPSAPYAAAEDLKNLRQEDAADHHDQQPIPGFAIAYKLPLPDDGGTDSHAEEGELRDMKPLEGSGVVTHGTMMDGSASIGACSVAIRQKNHTTEHAGGAPVGEPRGSRNWYWLESERPSVGDAYN